MMTNLGRMFWGNPNLVHLNRGQRYHGQVLGSERRSERRFCIILSLCFGARRSQSIKWCVKQCLAAPRTSADAHGRENGRLVLFEALKIDTRIETKRLPRLTPSKAAACYGPIMHTWCTSNLQLCLPSPKCRCEANQKDCGRRKQMVLASTAEIAHCETRPSRCKREKFRRNLAILWSSHF